MLYVPPQPVVILSAARTPQGPLGGALAAFKATQLGGIAIKAALERSGVAPGQVDECVMGNVIQAGLMQSPAKQAAVAAGIPHDRASKTVNTVCASGMTAIYDACQSLASGAARVAVAGGMESRSGAPYYLGPRIESGERLPGKVRGPYLALKAPRDGSPADEYRGFVRTLQSTPIREASIWDSLLCPFAPDLAMKDYAERFCGRAGLTVDEINAAAGESYRRTRAARAAGLFDAEIIAVGEVAADDIVSEEMEGKLHGISYGYVTAYNAPALGDGASAVVLTLESTARAEGWWPLARITAFCRIDTRPEDFVHAPVEAVARLRGATGRRPAVVEANESFGMQIPIFTREFDADVVNPVGGLALTHPVGTSGARVVVTLVHAMRRMGCRDGAAAICFGSGGAVALSLESL